MGEQPKGDRARTRLGVQLSAVLRALAVTLVLLGVLWAVQAINAVTDYSLTNHLSLEARNPGSLPKIFTVELVHVSLFHIEANSICLAVLAFLVALRGTARFLGVTAFIVGVGGAIYWLFGPAHVADAGASGLVFGYFGYLMLVGLVERNVVMLVVAGVVGVLAYLFYNGDLTMIVKLLTPSHAAEQANISWQGHLTGLIAGIFATGLHLDGDRDPARDRAAGPGRPAAAPVGPGQDRRSTVSGGLTDEELDRLLRDL